MFVKSFYLEAENWARGKQWLWRAVLLLFFVYAFIRHLKDPMYESILGPLNLGIHEFGHLIFMPFGEFMHMIGGTVFQVFVPLFAVFNFYRLDDYFSIALSFGWLSTNFFNIARYASDARRMELSLVTPFGAEPVHDWNYILVKLRLLHWDLRIGGFFKLLAIVSMLICFLFGLWLILKMIKNRPLEVKIKN
ncbi:MAG: hypothetical protein JW867_07020 [Candidatus Omnitrophica bacterium]|nr:hypothetical protein [Candidatus Omnitrophota bacterium]